MPFNLDHAVISVRDRMDEAAAIFARMGFTLTPRSQHRIGSINHLMVFEHNYLELLGFPPGAAQIRPDIIASPIGLDALVLDLADPESVYARLLDAGLAVSAPSELSRPVELASGVEEARFTTVRLDRAAVHGGRLYFCQHHTPHLIWRDGWRRHANGALGIERFTIAVPDPAKERALYETIIGGKAPAFIEFTTPEQLRGRLGDFMPDANGRTAYMAALTLRVQSLAEAKVVLQRGGFKLARLDERSIAVPASEAMNCAMEFSLYA